MQRKTLKWLRDMQASADFITRGLAGKTLEQYLSDAIPRAAVERHFEIIGEAMKRVCTLEPRVADHIPDAGRIVAFRN